MRVIEIHELLGRKSPKELFVDAITRESLEELYSALANASKVFNSAPRRRRAGARLALRALNRLFPSGPIAALIREITDAPGANVGEILHPYQTGQAIETNTRQDVDRLKACCAYAAISLSFSRKTIKKLQLKGKQGEYRIEACRDVAMVCLAYNFPREYFYSKGGRKKLGPSQTKYAKTISDWATHYPTKEVSQAKGKDAGFFFAGSKRENPF